MIDAVYENSVTALHILYQLPLHGLKLCDNPDCGFCSMLNESSFSEQRKSEEVEVLPTQHDLYHWHISSYAA